MTETTTPAAPSGTVRAVVRHRRSVQCGLLIIRGLGDAPYCNVVLAEERYGICLEDCVDAANSFLARATTYPGGEWKAAEREWERKNIMPNAPAQTRPASSGAVGWAS